VQSIERYTYEKFISQFLYLIKAVKWRCTRNLHVVHWETLSYKLKEAVYCANKYMPAEKFRRMRFIKILPTSRRTSLISSAPSSFVQFCYTSRFDWQLQKKDILCFLILD